MRFELFLYICLPIFFLFATLSLFPASTYSIQSDAGYLSVGVSSELINNLWAILINMCACVVLTNQIEENETLTTTQLT